MNKFIVTGKVKGLVTLQDLGRKGVQKYGISQGGALDENAYLWSNHLLENDLDLPAIEIFFGGLELECVSETIIAVTGADLNFTINDTAKETWRTHKVNTGDKLTFNFAKSGMIAYLAIKGGINTPYYLDSASTSLRECKIKNFPETIQEGDIISAIEKKDSVGFIQKFAPVNLIPNYKEPVKLGLIEGSQYSSLSPDSKNSLYTKSFSLSPNSNRVGYTLENNKLELDIGEITSEGIALGAVQIPRGGTPIVLLKDRPSTGGYPKIGCVSRIDLNKLVQTSPGKPVSFYPISAAEDLTRTIDFYAFFGEKCG